MTETRRTWAETVVSMVGAFLGAFVGGGVNGLFLNIENTIIKSVFAGSCAAAGLMIAHFLYDRIKIRNTEKHRE